MSNLGVRAQYDSRTLDLLSGFRPDLIVLSSYLYVLTAPMLSAFPARILNVHDSDLSIKNGQGDPKYIGLRSVRDAMLAGERETRATVHLVTQKLDGGPPLLRSWPFPVSPLVGDGLAMNASEMLKAYVFAHQEWMLRSSWGPLLARSIALLATDRVRFRGDTAWIDGVAGPWDLRPSDRGTMLIRPAHQMVLETGALSA
jgi:phosphoribosylglycinamide formyltransferase-1